MKKIDFQKVIEWLSFLLRCPVCGYKYNLERTKIIDLKQDEFSEASLLVHSDCGRCKSSVVFSINFGGPDVLSSVMASDLTTEDTQKFISAEPISAKDVLNLHDFFGKFDGDLLKVLKK